MQGLHLIADLRGCRCEPRWLTDAPTLTEFCVDAVRRAGLSPVGRLSHSFSGSGAAPGGVTVTVLLAESHVCVHSWPELSAVTLDVYVCNFQSDHSASASALFETLLRLFDAARIERHVVKRGSIAA